MTKQEMEDHKFAAMKMTWCDLADMIIDLEREKFELKEYHSKSDVKKYNKMLKIYEKEKLIRVQDQFVHIPWNC